MGYNATNLGRVHAGHYLWGQRLAAELTRSLRDEIVPDIISDLEEMRGGLMAAYAHLGEEECKNCWCEIVRSNLREAIELTLSQYEGEGIQYQLEVGGFVYISADFVS